jgi:hypothetical protein
MLSKKTTGKVFKKPLLIFTSSELLDVTINLIEEFDLFLIKQKEVRIITTSILITLKRRLETMRYNYQFSSGRFTLKLHELAALRICFIGSKIEIAAEKDPYLWVIYTQVITDNGKFI